MFFPWIPDICFLFSKTFSWASEGEEMDDLCFFRDRHQLAVRPALALSSLHPCPRSRGGAGAKQFPVRVSRGEEAV